MILIVMVILAGLGVGFGCGWMVSRMLSARRAVILDGGDVQRLVDRYRDAAMKRLEAAASDRIAGYNTLAESGECEARELLEHAKRVAADLADLRPVERIDDTRSGRLSLPKE